jgi:hypothetical protein
MFYVFTPSPEKKSGGEEDDLHVDERESGKSSGLWLLSHLLNC